MRVFSTIDELICIKGLLSWFTLCSVSLQDISYMGPCFRKNRWLTMMIRAGANIIGNAWLRTFVRPDWPDPRDVITKKKWGGPHPSFPRVSASERMRPLAQRGMHATCGAHACAVWLESAWWPERMTSPRSSWEEHRPASISAICCSCDGDRGHRVLRRHMCFRCCIYFIAYVARAILQVCFQIFQLFHLDVICFHLDVAYVAVAIHVCFKCMF
jgi:hypothetical protein